MQKITVKEVKGPLGKGEKKFYAVKDAGGAEYTTFDAKVADLNPGSVIEGEITITVKGEKQYINLGEWKLLEAGPLPAGNGHGGGDRGPYKRDTEGIRFEYELKAYIEGVKHISIEAQTAFNGVVKLLEIAMISEKVDTLVAELSPELWKKALVWAERKFDASMAQQESAPKAPETSRKAPEPSGTGLKTGNGDPIDPEHPFANVGQLLQWAHKEYQLSKATVMEICGVNEQTLSKLNLVDAHIAIVDYIKIFGAGGPIPE